MDDAILKRGLDSQTAKKLLEQYGVNELADKHQFSFFNSLFSQLNNFLPLLLIIAAIVSIVVEEYIDSFFILLIVFLNSILGALQESKAEKSLQFIKKIAITTVRVIRDGSETQIDSRYLVPGDVVYIESGNKVPADLEIVKSWNLEIEEAALTGESLPVAKSEGATADHTAFMGTVVVKGRAYCSVIATGQSTRLGTIAQKLIDIKREATPLQIKLNRFSRDIGFAGIVASLIVFILSFVRDKNLLESFLFSVSLAVAAVPEGLPAVMTITLGLGIEKMAKKGAIIRKLAAVETLGTVTLLATDKTGTLTTNKMSVGNIYIDGKLYSADDLPDGASASLLLLNGVVCSTTTLTDHTQNGDNFVGDATEAAILALAQKKGIDPIALKKSWIITDESPFDSKTKLMTTVARNASRHLIFTKGAPEALLPLCDRISINGSEQSLNNEIKKGIQESVTGLAKKGLRLIAFGYKQHAEKDTGNELIFLGMVAIEDPIRKEIRNAVSKAKAAGINVVMITGDNEMTAYRIGVEAGIVENKNHILLGNQIDKMGDAALLKTLDSIKIFARTSPEHKLRLVKLFQKKGKIVAVTGDGVNDALALKQAHIGIAMGKTGTDVAKETADMVITDDNFSTLVNAIEEGRNIFNNIKKAVNYLLITNFAEVMAVIFSIMFGLPPILTALQILYINLIGDGLPSLSFAFAPQNNDVMKIKPRSNHNLIERTDLRDIALIGTTGSMLTIFSFITGVYFKDIQTGVTMAFTTLVFIQPFVLADLWVSNQWIFRSLAVLKKKAFFISIIIPAALHPILLYSGTFADFFHVTALNLTHLMLALIYASGIMLILELRKITFLSQRLSLRGVQDASRSR